MRVRIVGLTAVVLTAVILGSGCNPDKNKLLFKPQQGAKRTVDTEEAINMSIKMAGVSMGFGSSMNFTLDMTTQNVDEQGVATFDVAFKSLSMDVTGLDAMMGGAMGGPGAPKIPGMPTGDDPFGIKSMKTALKAAAGQSFTVKVNKLGEVTEINGADAIAEKASEGFKPPAMGAAGTSKQVFVKMIGDDAMKKTMQSVFTSRPDKKLNAGDTWQDKITSGDAMATITQDATYTLKERAGGTVNVDIAAQMEFAPGADLMKQAAAMPGFKMEMSGQGTGTLQFDEASGWLVDRTSTANVPGNMTMKIPQMGDMSIPIEASYKMSVKSYPS